jgi:hypothetical protein
MQKSTAAATAKDKTVPTPETTPPTPLSDEDLAGLLRDLEDVSPDAANVIVGQGEQVFEALSALAASEECWNGREAGLNSLFLLAALGLPASTEFLLTGIKHGLTFGSVACLSRVGQLFRAAGSGSAARLRELYQDPEQQPFFRTACLEASAGLALDDKDVLATVVRDCNELRADESETDLALLSGQILAALLQDRYEPDIREVLGDDSDVLELTRLPLDVENFGADWWRASPLDHFSLQIPAPIEPIRDPGWKRGEPPPFLSITAAEAQALGDDELLALLREAGDGLPAHVVDAVVSRGDRLVPALIALLDDKALWAVGGREAWTVIHAAHLLAATGGEQAAAPLVQALRSADEHHVSVLLMSAEILFRQVSPASCGPALRELTHDADASEILQMCSLPSRSALALRDDALRVELLADFSALLKGDLAPVAQGWLGYFHAWGFADEVASALEAESPEAATKAHPWLLNAEAADQAKAHLLRSPLSFYSEEERRERWTAAEDDPQEDADPSDGPEEPADVEPFVREAPKVGRNDPCPCGSGRKFKRCCLRKA